MAQLSSQVKPSLTAFLNLFPGQHLFRALHPGFAENPNLAPFSYYGEHWEVEPRLRDLNARGWSIYFTANDPSPAGSGKITDFQSIRCIYQDADEPDTAILTQLIAGQAPHAVWSTSPGKFQRIWLTEPLPVEMQAHIHQIMVERHAHDKGASGVQRLLRLPTYANTKYPERPLAELLELNPALPSLTFNRIQAHFLGNAMDGDPNTMNALEGIQRSEAQPRATVYDLSREKAKRAGGRDAETTARADHQRLNGEPSCNLPINELLSVLARIDPSCGYSEWVRIISALHWMADGEEWGEDVAERWSMLGDTYKPASFQALWRSLKSEHARPAHWGTLKTRASAVKPDDPEARMRRGSPELKALDAAYPLGVPYRQFMVMWPDLARTSVEQTPKPRTNSPQNCDYLLDLMNMSLTYDGFRHRMLINKKERFNDSHLNELITFAHREKWDVQANILTRYIDKTAKDNTFNEPLEYFNKLIGKWDGRERLRNCCQRLLGVSETGYEGATFELMMVAIVRRIRQPGVKYDLMPVFEGDQGLGKTTFLQLLCPKPEWYSGNLRLDEEPKRLYALMQGKLIIEFAELAGRRDSKKIKQFLSDTADEFVANYDRYPTEHPRIACFAASTNEDQYLTDTTGNRRFPPLLVKKKLDWNSLLAEKEQLWAEAVWLEAMGDVFYSQLTLPDDDLAQMESAQENRLEISVGVRDIVDELCAFPQPFIQDEAIWQRLGIPLDRRIERTRYKYMLTELKNILKRRGWQISANGRVEGNQKKGHFFKKKGEKLRELIYTDSKFVYLDTLRNQQEGILS